MYHPSHTDSNIRFGSHRLVKSPINICCSYYKNYRVLNKSQYKYIHVDDHNSWSNSPCSHRLRVSNSPTWRQDSLRSYCHFSSSALVYKCSRFSTVTHQQFNLCLYRLPIRFQSEKEQRRRAVKGCQAWRRRDCNKGRCPKVPSYCFCRALWAICAI